MNNCNTNSIIFRICLTIFLLVLGLFFSKHNNSFFIFKTAYFIISYDIFFKTIKNIFKLNLFDENFLMCVASVGAVVLNEQFEAIMVILLYQIGELFLHTASHNSKQSIANLLKLKPKYANLKTANGTIKVSPSNIKINDIIVIKPTEQIPLDGEVIKGSSQLNTSSITGEAMPIVVKPGVKVLSGYVNLTETIEIKVNKLSCNSTFQQILNLIQNSNHNKSRSENFITKFSKIYTPTVVIFALFIAIIPIFTFSLNWRFYLNTALVILSISCPCALVISIPLSFFCALTNASKNLILIKNNSSIETISKIKTIIFDKTGTLTEGQFKIIKTQPNNLSEHDLLNQFAIAESLTNHPIASSVKIKNFNKIKKCKQIAGLGVITHLYDGTILCAGSYKLMEKLKISYKKIENSSNTTIYVAKNNKFSGSLIIADRLKPNAKAVINQLRKININTIAMFTGDVEHNANKIKEHLNLNFCFSKMLPDEKLYNLKKLQQNGPVIYVGDGINDVPALHIADVSIAMGKIGSNAAIETSSIVLIDDDLQKIIKLISISKKTMSIVKQNITIAIGIKFVILIISLFFSINLWIAMFADVGVSILTILNSTKIIKL